MKGGKMSCFKLSEVPKWKSMFGVGVDFSDEDVQRYRRFEGRRALDFYRKGRLLREYKDIDGGE